MAFLVYERTVDNGIATLKATGTTFSLAGHKLIYKAWEAQGKPINRGWHVGIDELVKLQSDGQQSAETRRLVIDVAPTAARKIGLIELLDVYAYTFGTGDPGEAEWTPLMLRMRDVLYDERAVTPEQKARIIAEIPEPKSDEDFIEFLYLKGHAAGWTWGRNGATNAAFIQKSAREYFRRFF
jgi:hypothetical protein